MKTKMYSLPPVLLIAMITVALSFTGKYAHKQMGDMKNILTPGTGYLSDKRAATIEADIDAYKKELSVLRTKVMLDQTAAYPPGCDPALASKLALANLHLKYNGLIEEQGYGSPEIDRLMFVADSSRVPDAICHNIAR